MQPQADDHTRRVVSAELSDGRLVEMLFDAANERTSFAVFDGKEVTLADTVQTPSGQRLAPYRPENAILRHRVALFPSEPLDYDTTADLVAAIRTYIHTYVDLSERFEILAAYYVLFSWLYDRFNELPYLRMQGEYGTGKTRFLLVVGSICRTPIFAGGASTTAPLFHMLDRFGGTLIIDEADFRLSDEKAQIAKILNNGNLRGFPVLRTESLNGREFSPRAYQVFGPKLIAMRTEFEDKALESRFITERSDRRSLRKDIPLNMPAGQETDALVLRNQLLTYRFRNFHAAGQVEGEAGNGLDPRTNQIFAPLLSIIEDETGRQALRAVAAERQQQIDDDRGQSVEAGVLSVVAYLSSGEKSAIPVSEIATLYSRAHTGDLLHQASGRWIGAVLRRAFGLRTRKSHGNYVLPTPDRRTLAILRRRFCVSDEDVATLSKFDVAEVLRVEPLSGADGMPQL
jgi:hypothetical protein